MNRSHKYVTFSILTIYDLWEAIKKEWRRTNPIFQLNLGIKSLNNVMPHVQYLDISNYSQFIIHFKLVTKVDENSITFRIYVSKTKIEYFRE